MHAAIIIDDKDIQAALDQLAARCADMSPVMQEIAGIMQGSTEDAFDAEASPDGAPWQATQRGGKILQDTGGLAASIARHYGDDFATIGSNKVYARIHQLGGQAGRGGSVNLPARPYLGISAHAKQKILLALKRHLTGD